MPSMDLGPIIRIHERVPATVPLPAVPATAEPVPTREPAAS